MPDFKVLLVGAYIGGYVPTEYLRGKPLAFFEPIVNRNILLRRMFRHLTQRGYDVEISPFGVSTRDIRETVSLHRDFIRESNHTWKIVGWSTGGVVGYGCLVTEPSKVSHVVALSTPVWGVTDERVNRDVARLGLSPDLYLEYEDPLLASSDRITVIMSHGDRMAPPGRCRLESRNGLTSRACHVLTEEEVPGRLVGHQEIGQSKDVFGLIDKYLRKEI